MGHKRTNQERMRARSARRRAKRAEVKNGIVHPPARDLSQVGNYKAPTARRHRGPVTVNVTSGRSQDGPGKGKSPCRRQSRKSKAA